MCVRTCRCEWVYATLCVCLCVWPHRGYAEKDAGMCFWPTKLGEALISGYRAMRLDNLWRPELRGRIENQIRDVAMGHVAKEQVRAGVRARARACVRVCVTCPVSCLCMFACT